MMGYERLIDILKYKGIPPNCLKFIYSLINYRELFGQFGGIEIDFRVTNKELPQGSILSPILCNLYISEIMHCLHFNCKLLSFADDILIYSSNLKVEDCVDELTISATEIDSWLKSLKLAISFDKSRLMFFSKDGGEFKNNSCRIQIDNCILNNCGFIKYLGVYIDSNLKFEIHIKYLIEKVSKLFNMFRCLCRFNFGSHPSIAIKIYKQFIRAALDWGGFLIEDCNNKIKKKLDVFQNSALRSSLGCIRTTPINVLLHLAGVSTLQNRREYLTNRFLARQMVSRQSMLIPKLKLLNEYVSKQSKCPNYIKFFLFKCWTGNIEILQEIRSNNGLATYLAPYDIQFYVKDIDLEMGKLIKHSKEPSEKFDNLILELRDINHYFYTDGSKGNDKCGFGVYADNVIESSHRINDKASIYSAEAAAILFALKTVERKDLNHVLIFTDSLSALERLKSLGLKSDNNLIIADMLICLNELLFKKKKALNLFGSLVTWV